MRNQIKKKEEIKQPHRQNCFLNTKNETNKQKKNNKQHLPGGNCAGFRISNTNNSTIPIKMHTQIKNIENICNIHPHTRTDTRQVSHQLNNGTQNKTM